MIQVAPEVFIFAMENGTLQVQAPATKQEIQKDKIYQKTIIDQEYEKMIIQDDTETNGNTGIVKIIKQNKLKLIKN